MDMDQAISAQLPDMQELHARLLALDQLLGSVPLLQQRSLDLEAILSNDSKDANLEEFASLHIAPSWDAETLYKVVDTVPRFDLIPATLINICKTSWQGRIYQNVYRHSDTDITRHPTCSEVLQLLPKLDRVLETYLNDKINAIMGLVPPFRFLDLPAELRLHAYAYILPRQPYLTLLNLEPRRHALPRYDLAALRTCRQMYSELVDDFYKDQTLVMNVYDMMDFSWAFLKTSPRDRHVVLNMREETRSCFKRVELRILDTEDPETYRKGQHWELMRDFEHIYYCDEYFTEILEAFPSLEIATVSYEIDAHNLKWWGGWWYATRNTVTFLVENIPKRIEIRWDFRPTSDPDLKELAEEDGVLLMDNLKNIVIEETAEVGGTIQLGRSIVREPIVSKTR